MFQAFWGGVPGFLGVFRVFWGVFLVFWGVFLVLGGVPGFLGVPGCSGVPVFRCSGVPGSTTCLSVSNFPDAA